MILPILRRGIQRLFKYTDPPDYIFQPVSDDKMVFQFKGPDDLEEWDVLSDADYGGKSSARLASTASGKAVFFGRTILEQPRGLQYSGFASMRLRERREHAYFTYSESDTFDLEMFDALEVRLRGDGRMYSFNLQTESYRRSFPDAVWQFHMFTRGGPEYEIFRMPFTKFIYTSEGYPQVQSMIHTGAIKSMGVLLRDRVNGPFRLELDYIKAIKTITYTTHDDEDLRPPRTTNMTSDENL